MNPPDKLAHERHNPHNQHPPRTGGCVLATAVALILALGSISLATNIAYLLSSSVYEKDFIQEWLLARAVADRADPYVPVRSLALQYVNDLPARPSVAGRGWDIGQPTPHPPPVAVLALPLALLDYPTAASVWWALEVALLALSAKLLADIVGVRLSPLGTFVVVVGLFVWSPVRQDLILGQFSPMLLVLMAGGWFSLCSRHPLRAGLLFGLALAIKPLVWLILPVLAFRRQWRALAGAVAILVLAYAVAGIIVGFDELVKYFSQVLPTVNAANAGPGRNFALSAVIESRVPSPFAVIASITTRILIVMVAFCCVRDQCAFGTWLGLAVCTNLLVNPITWDHYLVLAAIPATEVTSRLVIDNLPRLETSIALLAAGMLSAPVGVWMGGLPFAWNLVDAGYIVALVLLGWLLLVTGHRRRYLRVA
jgi:alpha-1,2-mannosyltransferase